MPSDRTRVPIVNAAGEEIPPGAVLEPDGTADADGRLGVRQVTADDAVGVWFNGPVPIPLGGAGEAFAPYPWAVAGVDPADSPLAPAAGSSGAAGPVGLGTRAGEWFLRPGGAGFLAVAPEYDGFVTVIPDPGTGRGGGAGSGDGSGSGDDGGSGSGDDGSGSGADGGGCGYVQVDREYSCSGSGALAVTETYYWVSVVNGCLIRTPIPAPEASSGGGE